MGTFFAMVTNFCGLHANINGSVQQIVHGIADDILDRLGKLDGLNAPHHIKAKGSGHDTIKLKPMIQRIKLFAMNF